MTASSLEGRIDIRLTRKGEGVSGVDICSSRPQLAQKLMAGRGPDEAAADFVLQGAEVHGLPGLVNLFGIESPGLTASLALADEVLRRLEAAAPALTSR